MNDKTKGFNVRTYRNVQEIEYELRDPEGEATGAVFKLAGPEFGPRKRLVNEISRRLSAAQAKANGRAHQVNPAEIEETMTDLLVTSTLGWRGLVDDDGNPLEHSAAAARRLYCDPELLWVREQIFKAIGDTELFIKRSGAT